MNSNRDMARDVVSAFREGAVAVSEGARTARTIGGIIAEVAAEYGVAPREITGPRRLKRIVIARQEAMLRCIERLDISYPLAGRHFGGRDHTTVMHGCKRAAERRRESR